MRFLGCVTLSDVHQMTVAEYSLRIKAYHYRELDEQQKLHELAWLISRVAPATKKNGKYAYKSFDKFFEYQKRQDELDKDDDISPIAQRLMAHRKDKDGRTV